MAKGDDIQERLINFAVSIINLCSELPKTQAGKHVAGQLLRSGTSPAPNYAEARGAESRNDFSHKLKITLKEERVAEVSAGDSFGGKMRKNSPPLRREKEDYVKRFGLT